MTAVAISQLPLRRRELDTEIPNSITTTSRPFMWAPVLSKLSHRCFCNPHQECRSTDHVLQPSAPDWGAAGFLLRSSLIPSSPTAGLLSVCFRLLFFSNLQPGWANSAMETMEMFAFCPCFIDSESTDCEASPNTRHSSKRTSAASSRAQQLLALWAMVMR